MKHLLYTSVAFVLGILTGVAIESGSDKWFLSLIACWPILFHEIILQAKQKEEDEEQ